MKKGDWIVILEDSNDWSLPLQLDTDPIMGWMVGDFSKIFTSAKVHSTLELEKNRYGQTKIGVLK